MGKVVIGGLAAGLIINIGETILNIPLLGAEMAQALQARNLRTSAGEPSRISSASASCWASSSSGSTRP
jgi:hypothetical protein